MSYFRAVRQLGIGSLHVAHIRQGDNNDQRPFGSCVLAQLRALDVVREAG